ncbi:glycosyltransferase family 4 protein [Methylocystis iwaonis]|uniref:Glycosyltransferase family 1 protein n=1 Tax=Methylocystis iwaonis TaxID=2885079 RepID=A0ABM8EDT2_9HYPH|nr:glycosyltransferase family 4 protein [Methylocystis iwaonis]BDV36180.1 hypothetical protein SS37A_37100 [Methylocystis iwaonis]
MKIGVVSNLFPPFSIGGYEQLCGKVCNELAALGHEIVVLTSTYGGAASDTNGYVVERRLKLLANEYDIYQPFRADPDERASITNANRLTVSDFQRRHQPDLWFLWNLFFLDDGIVDDLSLLGQPVVLFLTDNWLIAARQPNAMGQFFARCVHGSEQFSPDAQRKGDGAVMKQRAIFGSRFMHDLYESFGFNFEYRVVVHNGVDLPTVPPELFVPRTETREPGRLKILFAGRVVDIKGPQLIVAALPLIRARASQTVSLTIVGDVQDKTFASRLNEEIAASGCADLISFREPVSEAVLLQVFNDHDIYVFPSLYEPFSLTLIHAIGAGIPTVATNVGGNDEIVMDGETGVLFHKNSPSELADAVVRLAEDGRLRSRISHKGRHVARRFTFRRMIRRIENELLRAIR